MANLRLNLIEIQESKPLLENQEFQKHIFHFYFLNIDIFLGKLDTLMRILEHIENRCYM